MMFSILSKFALWDLSSAGLSFTFFVMVISTFLLYSICFRFVLPLPTESRDKPIKLNSKPANLNSKARGKTRAIHIFHDDGAGSCVDIVAVHGLASNPETTWNYKDADGAPPHWLRDFLPQENLNARIIAFNYNSEWKGYSLGKSLEDHGDDLLLALDDIRQTSEEQSRDIIFIGHSFGGIVIKQAVFNARIQRNPENFRSKITNKAIGFVFLGTPHKGSSLTFVGNLIALFYFWRGSSNSFLRAIKPGSTSNEQIHKSFLKGYSMEKMVVCFFETVRMSLWGIPLVNVVSKDSARIEQAECFGFEANHRNLQRFGSRNDPDYRKMLNFIRRFTADKKLVSSTVQPYLQGPSTLVPAKTVSTLSESIEFPVDTLSLGRIINFVGRDEQLSTMCSYMLKDQTRPGPISCLVHGTGGHGKTGFVREYAYRNKKHYDAIFWVEAETDIVLLRSFGAIGRALELFGDETIGQVQKEKILKWLKTTHRKWLLVFDNVVNQSDVRSYWPSSSRNTSSIIATSQFFFPNNWTEYTMKLDPLDNDDGSRFLLNQLHESDVAPYSFRRQQAKEISDLLGGSPLWLGQASALIEYNKSSLDEFLMNLRTSSNALEEEDVPPDWNYGKPALATFDTVLDTLSHDSKDLLFMIAFMNPERIEETMLLGDFKSQNLAFIGSSNRNKFLQMVGQLNKRNLVSRDKVKKLVNSSNGFVEELAFLTTHRSLQEGLLYKLNKSPIIRQTAFNRVIELLSEHCPRPLKTLQPVESHWPVIQTLLPHLLTLLRGFERSEPQIQGHLRFAELLVDMGGMTLYDHGFTSQVQTLLTKAGQILDEIGETESAPIRGTIGTVLGLNTDTLGITQRAAGLKMRKKTLAIRLEYHKRLRPEEINVDDEILLFNADTDLTCSLQQFNRFQEVEDTVERCLAQYKIWGDETEVPYEYAKYYNHMAYVLMYKGKMAEAVKFAERGSDLMALAQPGSQMAVTFRFDWATILFQVGQTAQAIEEHLKLLQCRISGCGGLDILTLQSRILIGIMYFLVADYKEADTWLRGSLQLAQEIEAPAEHLARTKYYLAQIKLRDDPRDKVAMTMDQEAKKLLFQLLDHDGSDSMKDFVAAKDYPMLFDYIVTWESRLITPQQSSQEKEPVSVTE